MYFVIESPLSLLVALSWAPQPDSLGSVYMIQSIFGVSLMDSFAGIIWLCHHWISEKEKLITIV